MEPGQTGQQLRATAEEEVSQQQPHLCSLKHLQQEDHEYYPVGRQCGELLTIYQSVYYDLISFCEIKEIKENKAQNGPILRTNGCVEKSTIS